MTAVTPKRIPMQIAGEPREGSDWETIQSPFDGSAVAEVGVAGAADMEDAIAASVTGFEAMRRLPVHARVRILEGIRDGIADRAEEIAQLMVAESGKPVKFARGEVSRAQVTFGQAAALARTMGGETMPLDLEARGEGRMCIVERVPRGPVAAISPFNFPLNLIAHKLAPAIAVGTSTVLKAPPQCPLTGHLLGAICDEAGLPSGGLSVLHCAPAVAQKMVEDDRLKVLSFTGSDVVGWKLKSLAGKKQVLLELGGNAPCILDEGADLDVAVPKLLIGAWAHAGQVCIKVQRIFVHESLQAAFMERFVAETQKLKAGDPTDPETVVGPLIDSGHAQRVIAWIEEAVAAGAVRHTGGTADGNVVAPTILSGVPRDQKVCKDEVFGPVTVIETFRELDEALAACNDSRFGLQAGIFTPKIANAMHAYRTLDYGGVLINDIPTFRVDNYPYGGTKDSGFGREGVRYAMEEMSEPKVLILA